MELEIIGDAINCFVGDTLTVTLECTDTDLFTMIDSVKVVSNALSISETMTKVADGQLFTVDIPKETTKTYAPGIYSFDVEVAVDNQILVSDSPKVIKIKERQNPTEVA